ncbi:hypothetical protein CC79DRAFT_1328621 [Sarocladium strictum]
MAVRSRVVAKHIFHTTPMAAATPAVCIGGGPDGPRLPTYQPGGAGNIYASLLCGPPAVPGGPAPGHGQAYIPRYGGPASHYGY